MCTYYCPSVKSGVRWWAQLVTDAVKEGGITQDEALNLLENAEEKYIPKGHEFTLYSGDELLSGIVPILGGAIVAFALIWLLMRVLGGERYG